MKAEELRLGNIVKVGFLNGAIQEFKSGFQCEVNTGSILIREEIEELKSIPLTEEWLLKFGFQQKNFYEWKGNGADWQPETSKTGYQDYVIDAKDEDYFFVRYERSSYRTEESHEWIHDFSTSFHKGSWYEKAQEHVAVKECRYVHQLQNLFYCLTGEELIIKL